MKVPEFGVDVHNNLRAVGVGSRSLAVEHVDAPDLWVEFLTHRGGIGFLAGSGLAYRNPVPNGSGWLLAGETEGAGRVYCARISDSDSVHCKLSAAEQLRWNKFRLTTRASEDVSDAQLVVTRLGNMPVTGAQRFRLGAKILKELGPGWFATPTEPKFTGWLVATSPRPGITFVSSETMDGESQLASALTAGTLAVTEGSVNFSGSVIRVRQQGEIVGEGPVFETGAWFVAGDGEGLVGLLELSLEFQGREFDLGVADAGDRHVVVSRVRLAPFLQTLGSYGR